MLTVLLREQMIASQEFLELHSTGISFLNVLAEIRLVFIAINRDQKGNSVIVPRLTQKET